MKITNYLKIKVWDENADRFFPDKESLIKWLDSPSLVPFLKHITDEADKIKFRNQVIEQVLEKTNQNGRYFEQFRRINVSAMK